MKFVNLKNHTKFDQQPPAATSGLFGCEVPLNQANLVIVPIPWDATASFRRGTSQCANAIVQASHQLDLEDHYFSKAYLGGIALWPPSSEIREKNLQTARTVDSIRRDRSLNETAEKIDSVNHASEQVDRHVYNITLKLIKDNKLVGILGGDHSVPFGFLRALEEQNSEFGILHIDAHFDLRDSYEGFAGSHASIMSRIVKSCSKVVRIVHLGIRDFCTSELEVVHNNHDRHKVYFDQDTYAKLANGMPLNSLVKTILSQLPERVYISFDIDGLSPEYCPNTGTPVPGGLSFNQAVYLLEEIARQGKKVVGFDLCEVASDPWDANVGARLLYKLSSLHLATNARI